jgi:hypothetical protein
MSGTHSNWNDVKARGQALDPRTPEDQAEGKAAVRDRTDAYIRGHQLARIRAAARITQADPADRGESTRPPAEGRR